MVGCQAALQEGDNLSREASKVHEDALLQLQPLEVVLGYFKGVQGTEVLLCPDLDNENLRPQQCCDMPDKSMEPKDSRRMPCSKVAQTARREA